MTKIEFHGGIRGATSEKAERKKMRKKVLARLKYEHDWFCNHDWNDEPEIELGLSVCRAEEILENGESGTGPSITTEEIETLCNELQAAREAHGNVRRAGS